jgi:phosphoribosylformylglycinamidine synthase subunit PurQ / glutaminase
MKPTTLILRTAGTNCDVETAYAFELAGARAQRVHINEVLSRPARLGEYQLLAIPGGFSYGDDIAAGRIFANQIVHHLRDAVRAFIEAGKPVIGVCNGFQVLVKTDLLPGSLAGRAGQNCTLAHNDCGRFVDRWITLKTASKRCIWTQGLGGDEENDSSREARGASVRGRPELPLRALNDVVALADQTFELPIAHGEGKFVPADQAVRAALWENDQVALAYTKPDGSAARGEFPHNPNGSVDDIAGVCDASGLVLGLMPHPERFVTSLQHPAWTRRAVESGSATTDGAGIKLFRNAVRHVLDAVGTGV